MDKEIACDVRVAFFAVTLAVLGGPADQYAAARVSARPGVVGQFVTGVTRAAVYPVDIVNDVLVAVEVATGASGDA